MDTEKFDVPACVTAEDIIRCLLAESQYWRDADCDSRIVIGAIGALANVVAFATCDSFRAPWHPRKEGMPVIASGGVSPENA